MTTVELIPILKALHHDPRCSPMMADWFEERGDEQLATWLRLHGAMVPEGWILIQAVMELPLRSRQLVADAVTADACRNLEMFDSFYHLRIAIERDISEYVELRTGLDTRRANTVNCNHRPKSDFDLYVKTPHYNIGQMTAVMANDTQVTHFLPPAIVVRMQYGRRSVITRSPKMSGGYLILDADFWFGVHGGDIYLSELHDSHLAGR